MKAKGPIVGIDLGTTYSLVSAFLDGRPTVLPSSLGEVLTPSAVSLTDDGAILVGAPAKARATTHPNETFLGFKRDMGTDKVFRARDKSFSAPELSAMVLSALKRDAEEALGASIEEAVVTVPAYFGDLQRQATRDAGAIAGLKVERIINEPTAAALAYGLHQRHREVRVAVLDLGGGTFDVTLLEIIEGVVEIQSSAGDIRLGGDDFDEALAKRVAARIEKSHGERAGDDPVAWARLVAACERAKHRLSTATTARIALPDLFASRDGRGSVELEISREEAEEAWAPWIEKLRAPIDRALVDAGVGPDRIDEVLLVGGSTRMPCVSRVAAQRFGRLPLQPLPPDEAVAMGAAVQAALKAQSAEVSDLVITDVAPFSLGISTVERFGPTSQISGVFTPILERGTVIPASRMKRFSTTERNQSGIRVEVFQGERSLCKDNRHLGTLEVRGLPAGDAGDVHIDIRFTYDQNGILEVETTLPATGKRETLVLEQVPGRLTKEAISQARKNMERLKIDPRETLPNRTALARADALFAELTGANREALGHCIAAFRGALEQQDDRAIRAAREQLVALTQQLHAAR